MRKGQQHTRKSKERIRKGHLGVRYPNRKKISLKDRKKLSRIHKKLGHKPPSRRGIRPWNYQGKTKLVEQIRKCFEYRQWRSSVFRRDRFTCQHCWEKGGILNADHIKKFAIILKENKIKTLKEALGCEELWDINNGRTLCIDTNLAGAELKKRMGNLETKVDNLFQYKDIIREGMGVDADEVEIPARDINPPKWCKCDRRYMPSTLPKEFADGLDQFKTQYLISAQHLTRDELDEIKTHNRDCFHNRICALYSEHIDTPLYG